MRRMARGLCAVPTLAACGADTSGVPSVRCACPAGGDRVVMADVPSRIDRAGLGGPVDAQAVALSCL